MRPKLLARLPVSRNGVAPNSAERPTARTARRTSAAAEHSSDSRRAHRTTQTLLHSFERHLRKHALSPITIRNYLADLRAFIRWLRGRGHRLARLAPADFHAYREHLCYETDHSTATVNRHLQSLRLFSRYMFETGQLHQDLSSDIELVYNGQGNHTPPRTLAEAEIARLRNAVWAGRPTLIERDEAIVQLMLQAGLRVHEVAALKLGDLSLARGQCGIDVKCDHAHGRRAVPLNAESADVLRRYLAVRPPLPHVKHLFVSQRGKPLSVRSIQRLIDTHARAAGLEGVCAQTLRNTCAKAMLEKTQNAALVAERLGQRNTRMLVRYIEKPKNNGRGGK